MEKDLEELLSKKEFDELFKKLLIQTEEILYEQHQQYIDLLEFRMQYRTAYKTHRIKHYLDKNNVLKFKKMTSRTIGYRRNQND